MFVDDINLFVSLPFVTFSARAASFPGSNGWDVCVGGHYEKSIWIVNDLKSTGNSDF